MTILGFTWRWDGLTGLPGYTTFFVTNAGLLSTVLNNASDGQRELWRAVAPGVPSAVTWTMEGDVKEYDATTGALLGIHTPPSFPLPVTAGGGAAGPLPSGACISWTTNGINRGRKVRGRTFVVPLAASAYESNGTLTSAFLTLIRNGATAYRTSAGYETLVWSRPLSSAGGAAFPIQSSSVTDQAAVLRSRRD